MTKISISLPDGLLDAAEGECRRPGESRSELFRRALESLLREVRDQDRVARYVAGYIAEPEEDDDAGAAVAAARAAFDQDPWD